MPLFIAPLDWFVGLFVALYWKIISLLENIVSFFSFGKLMDFDSPIGVLLTLGSVFIVIVGCIVFDFIVQHKYKVEDTSAYSYDRLWSHRRQKKTQQQLETLRDVQSQPQRLPDFMMRKLLDDNDKQITPQDTAAKKEAVAVHGHTIAVESKTPTPSSPKTGTSGNLVLVKKPLTARLARFWYDTLSFFENAIRKLSRGMVKAKQRLDKNHHDDK